MAFGSTSGVTFAGLASGLDTNSIVSQLVQLERLPIQRLQQRQGALQTQKGAYTQFRSQLQALNTAIGSFSNPSAFTARKATSSADASVSITATDSAQVGLHDVVVTQLASAEKIASRGMASPTAALGLSGSFSINGKAITLASTDTLNDLATKIASADAGVTASVVNGGSGKAFLTLSATKSGAANKINFTETTSGQPILSALGYKEYFTNPITNGFQSSGVNDPNAALNTQMTFGATTTFNFKINGNNKTFDVATNSLDDLKAMFAAEGYNAKISEEGGQFKLEVTSASGSIDISDTSGFMQKLGILSSPTRLVEAKDALFKIDGIDLSSDTNTIQNVIQGATLTLKKADPAATVNLEISKDESAAVDLVKGFVTAYNKVQKFVKDNSKFDTETFRSGVLFGDSVATQLQDTLGARLFSTASNLSGPWSNLTQIGLALDSNGDLQVDEQKLKDSLSSNPTGVRELFRSNGRSSNSNITFVSSGTDAKASSATGFEINITQVATKSTGLGALAQTTANRGSEILTFSGQMFGSAGYQLNVGAGTSAADLVNTINSDSKLSQHVVASLDGGKLKLESKTYGSATGFTVHSNQQAATDNSGVGIAGEGTFVSGLNIAGTINGQAATGSGQFLLSDTGDAKGIQIQYTGTATGAVGSLVYTKGVGGGMLDDLNTFLNSEGGLLQTSFQALDLQIEDLNDQIKRVSDRATRKEAELRQRFLLMEQAIQAAQSQSSRMQAMFGQKS